MKKFQLLILISILSFISPKIVAQDTAGVWKGSLYNDTTKKYYPYQIVISEDGGKLSGYSYIVYDINGKGETAVRSLKIKKKDAKLFIEDDDLIYNDYSEAPPKGIHKITIGTITIVDTVMTLSGEWHTNRTKQYVPLAGTFSVQKKNDYKSVELFKKLQDLKLDNTLSFIAKPAQMDSAQELMAAKEKAAQDAEEKKLKEEQMIAAKKKAMQEAEEKKRKEQELVASKKKAAQEAEEKKSKEEQLMAIKKKSAQEAEERIRKEEQLMAAKKKTEQEAEEKKRKEEKLIAAEEERAIKNQKKETVVEPPVVGSAAADVAKRKIINTQEVFFTSDSLILTLYDNGEVDGDIVSVLMNGKIIFEKTLLTTKPNRKTIYIDKSASSDSLQLVMYAENLGSIPPNTGLLVVNDGDAVYEVRFSADLQTNAAILLRRKK